MKPKSDIWGWQHLWGPKDLLNPTSLSDFLGLTSAHQRRISIDQTAPAHGPGPTYQLPEKKSKKSWQQMAFQHLIFCNEISSNFKDLSAILNLSNDDFIRTTEKRHKMAVENLWNILEKKNEIYLSKYSGWYSVSDEAFYSENEIEDKDNVKVNKLSGSKVEWVEEESFFLNYLNGKKNY